MTDKEKIADLLPQLRQAALATRGKSDGATALNNLIVEAAKKLGVPQPKHTRNPNDWNAIIDRLDAIDPMWRGYMPGEGQRDAAA